MLQAVKSNLLLHAYYYIMYLHKGIAKIEKTLGGKTKNIFD